MAETKQNSLCFNIFLFLMYGFLSFGPVLVIEPVLEGKTCKALPSATAFLIVFAILAFICFFMEVYNNCQRIKNGKNPRMAPKVLPSEGELYRGHGTLANCMLDESAARTILLSDAKDPKLAHAPGGFHMYTTGSPGSEARSASRRRRRACFPPSSSLGWLSRSSCRARRSASYSRPVVRRLTRAVDAVESDIATTTGR